jgi:hypothetical protein
VRSAILTVAIPAAIGLVLVVGARSAVAKVHPKAVVLLKDATGKCVHEVGTQKVKLSKKRDVAILEVSNDGVADANGNVSGQCGKSQDVALCTYVNDALVKDRFELCASAPTTGRDLNKPFPVAAGEIVRLMCLGKTTGSFKLLVDSADSITVCPAKPPADESSKERPRTHVIDIEIVP